MRAGDYVFRQGDPCRHLYWVVEGAVAIRKADRRGSAVIVRLAAQGDPLGYRAFLAADCYAASAQALTDVRVRRIDREVSKRSLLSDPSLGIGFLGRLALDLVRAEEMWLALVHWPVRERLVYVLLKLGEKLGRRDGEALELELPFEPDELAGMIGTRTPALERGLQLLEARGALRCEGRRIRIVDVAAARAMLPT